jgi:hypothetical protein
MTSMSYEVKELKVCRICSETGKLQLLVAWKGFTSADDSWEDLENLHLDVFVLVTQYGKKEKKENQELAEEINKFIDHKS